MDRQEWRMDRQECLSYVFIALLFPSLAFAAIDGTVYNRTTGKPQPGATVTLYKLGQNGLESVESVKSGAQGEFQITQDFAGPRLLQSAYDGVTYNHMLPPGSPTSNVDLDVYNSSKQPGKAEVAQHMVLLETARGQLAVSESYVFRNDGKTTYNDPDGGTLHFYLPPAAKGMVQVNCTAPQGMPIRRAADKTEQPDVYKVDFPIKPGETRIDLGYSVPFTPPGVFESKILYKGGPTRLVAPQGVTFQGDGIELISQEPRTKASIYNVKGSDFKVQIAGTGALQRGGEDAADENAGPSIEQIKPKVYEKLTWILALALSILALGFALLYRAHTPESTVLPAKDKNERRRR